MVEWWNNLATWVNNLVIWWNNLPEDFKMNLGIKAVIPLGIIMVYFLFMKDKDV